MLAYLSKLNRIGVIEGPLSGSKSWIVTRIGGPPLKAARYVRNFQVVE